MSLALLSSTVALCNKSDDARRKCETLPSFPANPECVSHCSMLGICVNLGLHTHQLCENLGVSGVFKVAVLSNSRDSVFIDSGP